LISIIKINAKLTASEEPEVMVASRLQQQDSVLVVVMIAYLNKKVL
jgi:hypothetical protein